MYRCVRASCKIALYAILQKERLNDWGERKKAHVSSQSPSLFELAFSVSLFSPPPFYLPYSLLFSPIVLNTQISFLLSLADYYNYSSSCPSSHQQLLYINSLAPVSRTSRNGICYFHVSFTLAAAHTQTLSYSLSPSQSLSPPPLSRSLALTLTLIVVSCRPFTQTYILESERKRESRKWSKKKSQ